MVGVNRNSPGIGQPERRADLIHVTVCENDRFRPRSGSKTRFRRGQDLFGLSGQSSVNDNPFCTGTSNEVDIGETHR